MKQANVFTNTELCRKSLWLGAIIFLMFSCDSLESDSDIKKPTAAITGKEIYVQSGTTAVIDLNSRIQVNQKVTLSVTSLAKKGTLSNLGGGLVQYTPSTGSTRTEDAFEFTVYAANNDILSRDSVIVIIEDDSTHLPCGIYPVDDIVYGVPQGSSVAIDVLRNDFICGYDSSELNISVYAPDPAFPPSFGSASVQGSSIHYTPGSNYTGTDKIIYKVSPKNDPAASAYGLVYITNQDTCTFHIQNDFVSAVGPLTEIRIDALANDQICQSVSNYQINISVPPLNGTVLADSGVFIFRPNTLAGPGFHDYFEYEVCLDGACKSARVDIVVQSPWVCRPIALPDSFNIADSTHTVVLLDVLVNDSICDNLTTLSIVQNPDYGMAYVMGQKIAYQPNPQQVFDDKLEYRLCKNDSCSSARVLIKRTN